MKTAEDTFHLRNVLCFTRKNKVEKRNISILFDYSTSVLPKVLFVNSKLLSRKAGKFAVIEDITSNLFLADQ